MEFLLDNKGEGVLDKMKGFQVIVI